jgi:deazaflavin-dependent oxidoreductase (nitroreductase family)
MTTTSELKQFNQALIAEFRANGGKVSGWHALLLLTTIGAKRGQPHTTPLVYSIDGDRIIVIAAHLGAPTHPAWYHNLVVTPEVTVELGDERFRMRAIVAEGQERERLFNQHAEHVPAIVAYQGKTTRQIPVVVLERANRGP